MRPRITSARLVHSSGDGTGGQGSCTVESEDERRRRFSAGQVVSNAQIKDMTTYSKGGSPRFIQLEGTHAGKHFRAVLRGRDRVVDKGSALAKEDDFEPKRDVGGGGGEEVALLAEKGADGGGGVSDA